MCGGDVNARRHQSRVLVWAWHDRSFGGQEGGEGTQGRGRGRGGGEGDTYVDMLLVLEVKRSVLFQMLIRCDKVSSSTCHPCTSRGGDMTSSCAHQECPRGREGRKEGRRGKEVSGVMMWRWPSIGDYRHSVRGRRCSCYTPSAPVRELVVENHDDKSTPRSYLSSDVDRRTHSPRRSRQKSSTA